MGASASTGSSTDNPTGRQPGVSQNPAFSATARAVNDAQTRGNLLCQFSCRIKPLRWSRGSMRSFMSKSGARKLDLTFELYEQEFVIKGSKPTVTVGKRWKYTKQELASGKINPKEIRFYLGKPAEYLKQGDLCRYAHDKNKTPRVRVLRRYHNDGLPTFDIKRFTGEHKKSLLGRKKLSEEIKKVPVTDINVVIENDELDQQNTHLWCVYDAECYALEVGFGGQTRETVIEKLKRHGGMIVHSKGGAVVLPPRQPDIVEDMPFYERLYSIIHSPKGGDPQTRGPITPVPSFVTSMSATNQMLVVASNSVGGPRPLGPNDVPSEATSSSAVKEPALSTVLQRLQCLMQPTPKHKHASDAYRGIPDAHMREIQYLGDVIQPLERDAREFYQNAKTIMKLEQSASAETLVAVFNKLGHWDQSVVIPGSFYLEHGALMNRCRELERYISTSDQMEGQASMLARLRFTMDDLQKLYEY